MKYFSRNEKEIYRMKVSRKELIFKILLEVILINIFLKVFDILNTLEFIDFLIVMIGFVSVFILLLYSIIKYICNPCVILTNERIIYINGYNITSNIDYKVANGLLWTKNILIKFSKYNYIKINAKAEYIDKFIEKLEIILGEKYQEDYKKDIEVVEEPITVLYEANKNIYSINKKEYTFEEKMKFATMNAKKYYLKNTLMDSAYEKIFFETINNIINDNYIIIPHVSLREVFSPKNVYEDIGNLAKYHIDFFIYKKEDYKPICAIEINGYSHQEEKQIVADTFKRELFNQYSILYIVFKNEDVGNKNKIIKTLNRIHNYNIYCRHGRKNKKLINKGNNLYFCKTCGKVYICEPLIKQELVIE